MKQDKGNWTEAVRRSLAGAEQPLPEGGWTRLERELGGITPAVSQVPVLKRWMKFAAAAAAVLVCVSIGIRSFRSDKNVLERVVLVSEAAVSEQNTSAGDQNPPALDVIRMLRDVEAPQTKPASRRARSSAERQIAAVTPAVVSATTPVVKQVSAASASEKQFSAANTTEPQIATGTATDRSAVRDAVAESARFLPAAAEEAGQQESLSAEHIAASSTQFLSSEAPAAVVQAQSSEVGVAQAQSNALKEQNKESVVEYNSTDYDGLFASVDARKQTGRGGSVAFSAGGVVAFSDGGSGMGSGAAMWLMDNDGAASIRNAYKEYSYDHKQPLSFGLLFRKEFKYGLSLESGLTYTLLRSDVTVPGSTRNVRQSLHFIGIPLRMNWEFLRIGGFSLYAGVGGAAEKCLSARFGGEKIKEKKVQWSLSGVVGAQYRLGKTVGIYFEPEVSHYLTETMLRTSYTDSAVSLNLQLGLRFNY